MNLRELFSDYLLISDAGNQSVAGLKQDSRKVLPGEIFFAMSGSKLNGQDFIKNALANGATAVVVSGSENTYKILASGAVKICLQNLQQALGGIAAKFYNYPSKKLTIIAVTGTNGKSTCVHLGRELLLLSGYNAASIGTLGVVTKDNVDFADAMTTPGAIFMQQTLARLLASGVTHVMLEASSHGLAQDRLAGVDFAGAIFTNLTRDHLDYHGSMAEYGAAKAKLFEQNSNFAILNADDEFSNNLKKVCRGKIFMYSLFKNAAYLSPKNVSLSTAGQDADILLDNVEYKITTKLLGDYNLGNLFAVILALVQCGVDLKLILQNIPYLTPPPGRMEVYRTKNNVCVVVDYAHTPDALYQALANLKSLNPKTLYCVFGCGGNRDRGKRTQMANAAQQLADYCIICDDNPRFEDPQEITAQISSGFSSNNKYLIINDRSDAILHAIALANSGDVILVAGKGHEDYQLVADKKLHFSDREVVASVL